MPEDWQSHRIRHQQFRLATEPSTLDIAARTVRATVATGDVIEGMFGPEQLVMTPSAIDLTRAADGLPWHDTHGRHVPGLVGERIGRAEDFRLEGGRLTATLRASRNEGGEAALKDIEDGIITGTSVGFEVLAEPEIVNDVLQITRWAPFEVSTPSITADPAAVIHRLKSMDAPKKVTQTDAVQPKDESAKLVPAVAARVAEIDAVFTPFPQLSALRTKAFAEGWDLERTRAAVLASLGTEHKPLPPATDQLSAGEDGMEKFTRGVSAALQTRANLIAGDAAVAVRRDNPYFGLSLREVAREFLRVAGDKTGGDAKTMIGRAFTRAGIISHSTSDFAAILADTMGKSMQRGYEEAPETYAAWTTPGDLPDFKPGSRPQLSLFSDLEQVNENGEFTYGTFGEFAEPILLLTFGRLFSLTRQAIINDDLAAFTRIPRGMGRAATRKVGDLVYAILTGNPNLSDNIALFHASHGNLAAAGAVPSVQTLNEAYTAMATQTDPSGKTLNIAARYILAPHALRGTIDALLDSALDPSEGTTTSRQSSNIWRSRLTPVYDARLDKDSATAWYLATDPAGMESIEVAYLNGVQTPRLEEQAGFTVDGVTMKVAHDVGVAPLEHRGLYKNPGAP